MSEKIIQLIAGGCPKCGNPEIDVPDDYAGDTEIKCDKCGHKEPHLTFFKAGEE